MTSKLYLQKYQYFIDQGILIKLTTKHTADCFCNYLSYVS